MKRRIFTAMLAILLVLLCGCGPSVSDDHRTESSAGITQATLPSAPETTTSEPTQPPETEPPVTEPPVTEPPETEPPATEPSEKMLTVCIDAGHQRYGISEKRTQRSRL